jgi:hypothetical protein
MGMTFCGMTTSIRGEAELESLLGDGGVAAWRRSQSRDGGGERQPSSQRRRSSLRVTATRLWWRLLLDS